MTMPPEHPIDPKDFGTYYRFTPAALAIRECARLRVVRPLDLAEPILDVGCGDGLFARIAYPSRQSWGLDINPSEVSRAQASAAYSTLLCGNISSIDLPREFFGSAVANCSLEHVTDIHGALSNIHRALKPGGRFAMIVPTPDWTRYLAVPSLLRRAGLDGLALAYGEALDNVFAHRHLYDEATWREFLAKAGFTVEDTVPIADSGVLWAFDAMLYPSLLGLLTKKVTGRWIASSMLRPLTVDIARRVLDMVARMAPVAEGQGEFMFVCRRPA